jgi:hypothetical protein
MKNIFLVIILLAPTFSEARLSPSLTYEQLRNKSDLVVIATPVENSKITTEHFELPDIKVKVVGVETKMRVATTLKGVSTKEITLHHYGLPDPKAPQINGPQLAFFNATDVNQRHSLLLFLIKEKDGRYAPAGGQTDPRGMAISELPVDTDSELINILNKNAH